MGWSVRGKKKDHKNRRRPIIRNMSSGMGKMFPSLSCKWLLLLLLLNQTYMSTNRGLASHETGERDGNPKDKRKWKKEVRKKKLMIMCFNVMPLWPSSCFLTHTGSFSTTFGPWIGYIFRRFDCIGRRWVYSAHVTWNIAAKEDQTETCTHTQADGLCYNTFW